MAARLFFSRGSPLAEFAGAQAPADHALLSRLPEGGPGELLMVDQLRSGPFRAAMLGLMDQLTRIWLNDAAAASMRACLEQLTGGMVVRLTPDAASVMLLEVTDAGATMRHSRAFTAEQDDVTFTPRALVHDGIEIDHEIPNDSSSDSEETMSAGFGRYYLTVMGATELAATTRAAVDAARGKSSHANK